MPGPVFAFLKYLFLVVLYLFFIRVIRAVWTELREPQASSVAAAPAVVPAAAETKRKRRGGGKNGRVQRLRVDQPPERAGEWFDLGEELTVGRAPSCGVSLPEDTFVSQVHARVFRRDDGFWIEDLGSTNGTFLNDAKVSAPVALSNGDRLKVGRTVMELT